MIGQFIVLVLFAAGCKIYEEELIGPGRRFAWANSM
jgi:hypothetical protein